MGFAGEIMGMAGTVLSAIGVGILVQNNVTALGLNRSERFKNAIEQLGKKENPVVLGALYSLHRIAQEDETYGENVFNILCAYVRDTTAEGPYQNKYRAKPSEPVQAALNLLCLSAKDAAVYARLSANPLKRLWQRLRKQNLGKFTIDFSYAFLNGAYLEAANLEGADLQKASLQRAVLYKASLQGAILWGANLEGAKLEDASLQGAYSSGGWLGSFEERIRSRVGEDTDLSGIEGPYDASSPPFLGAPMMGILTPEMAEEIIADYKKREGQ